MSSSNTNRPFNSRHISQIFKYINTKDNFNEELPNNKAIYNTFEKANLNGNKIFKNNIKKRKNKTIAIKNNIQSNLLKLSLTNDNSSLNNVLYSNTQKIKTIKRYLSNKILPCKTILLSKKGGFKNNIILKNINNIKLYNSPKNQIKKCLSASNNLKKKNININMLKEFDRTPLDLLVEKKEIYFDNKNAHKKITKQKILEKFNKKNFKNVRDNFFMNKFFYIKSRLNINSNSTKKKFKDDKDKALIFDNKKFKIVKNISKDLKNKIKCSAKNLDSKKLIKEIKQKENVKNMERLSELKDIIEDKNILLTPKNFLKEKRDPFIFYRINQVVQSLNTNLTYKNRFILAKHFDIKLDEFLIKKAKNT